MHAFSEADVRVSSWIEDFKHLCECRLRSHCENFFLMPLHLYTLSPKFACISSGVLTKIIISTWIKTKYL